MPVSSRKKRNRDGASIYLIIVAAGLLAVLIYLGFQFCMLSGGSREVRNAVDASVLNLSKRIVEIKVQPDPSYRDCADTNGMISVTNINRVWGKSLLINANQDEMTDEGLATADSAASSDLSYDIAQQINSNLRDAVTNKGTLDQMFLHMSEKRNAQLLGSGVSNAVEHAYPIALVDRGAESNLTYNPGQFVSKKTQVSGVEVGKNSFFSGYTPMKANGKTFAMMSFRVGETPHLISDGYFNQNRADSKPIPNFRAIPNAFQASGTASNGSASLGASASAVVNPQRQYKLAIPQAFIKIQFQNMSNWYINDKLRAQWPYKATPEKVWGLRDAILKDKKKLNGWAMLGTEFSKGNIYDAIHALPGDHTPAMQRLLQRAQEIDPSFNYDKLVDLMRKNTPPDDEDEPTYFIFPHYSQADYTDPHLDVQPKMGGEFPKWLDMTATEDGISKTIMQESKKTDYDNTWVYITGSQPDCTKYIEIFGAISWRPGTGYTQCLGTLQVSRLTKVHYKPNEDDDSSSPGK